jgi:hypothetical protein
MQPHDLAHNDRQRSRGVRDARDVARDTRRQIVGIVERPRIEKEARLRTLVLRRAVGRGYRNLQLLL